MGTITTISAGTGEVSISGCCQVAHSQPLRNTSILNTPRGSVARTCTSDRLVSVWPSIGYKIPSMVGGGGWVPGPNTASSWM